MLREPRRRTDRELTPELQWITLELASLTIRHARVGEHEALTDLSFRSCQQAWNYTDEFMAWEPDAISVTAEHISNAFTNVLEQDGRAIGFYVLRGSPPEIEMSRLMIAPEFIGTGCGRLLWDHAVETAGRLGCTAMTLDADPNAEPFYRRMGAETVGEHEWEPPMMPGWRVKKMRIDVLPIYGMGAQE
jgi:GNAT superfamily N-acetyltransferase